MLKQRIITALWLAPLALLGLFWLDGVAFALFTAAVVLLASWEWVNLAGHASQRARLRGTMVMAIIMLLLWNTAAVHATWPLWLGVGGWLINLYWVMCYPNQVSQWQPASRRLAMGLWVLLPCWIGFISLRESGVEWLLFVLLLVWCADTGAYFAGRAYGQHKLAPAVSPGKTWEGVVGGLLATTLLALMFAFWQALSLGQGIALVIITWIVTLLSVLGDLLESMLKRHRGIKDSSALLPGHGGILDRIDSLTAAVPWFALLGGWL